MPPIVSIVGKSGVGKTQFLEHLITEFKKRGYRIAVVKHTAGPIDMDKPGKDTWRFAQAGSDAVAISSPAKFAFIKNVDHDLGIEEALPLVGSDFDLILAEGFRKGKVPKIEVYRRELGEDLLCSPRELSAIITERQLDVDLPQFPPYDTEAIASFIEKNFILAGDSNTSVTLSQSNTTASEAKQPRGERAIERFR